MIPFELRPWRSEDLSSLVKHANDPDIAGNLMDTFPHPYTEAAGRAFLEMRATEKPAKVLAIVVRGDACGAVGMHPQGDVYRRNAELGYWIAREHWGKGIMTEAVKRMVGHTFVSFPEIHRLFARPFGRNRASQRVLEKAGFTLEAKLVGTMIKNGLVEDEMIYAVRR